MTAPRRHKSPDGQGTVYKVYAADGKTVVRYRWELMVGHRPDGSRDTRRGSAKTEREARKELTRVAALRDCSVLPSATALRETVGSYLSSWLAGREGTVSQKSWRRDEQLVELHIVPDLGALKLDRLKAEDVRVLQGAKLAAGLAPATVTRIRGVLAMALEQAVQDEVLTRNVVRQVKRPRQTPRHGASDEKRAFSPQEVEGIRRASLHDRFHGLWMVALHSGMRSGELRGLMWRDIGWQERTITVQRNLDGVAAGDPITSDPKTAASRRTIHVSEDIVGYLRAQRQAVLAERLAAGASYRDHDLVFCSRLGTPILAGNLIRSFHGLMRRLGFPAGLTPHNLRHTCATNLLYAGRALPEVAQYLGHANQGVTATVYAHVIARGTHDTAEALAQRYRAASSPAGSPAPAPKAAGGAR